MLYVGRFEPLKGIDGLLEAISYLKQYQRLRLVLVGGDGDEAPESQRLKQKVANLDIEDKVLFAGRVDQADLPPYYSSADALVISSHYESFGLVGLESLACGRPVVSTPVGAMETLINQSQAGYIINDTLPRSLAAGIQSMITNANLPRSDEIRKSVLRYSWSDVATAMLKEYETVIEDRSFADERPLLARASCG
jgi:D-inositol-3-phosphate glycosyltransferase